MRALLRSNKRGVSVIVGYVLLISMSIALSVMVYNWLKFYADDKPIETCPSGVGLVIKEVKCDEKSFSLTVQNKGRFTVDGFYLRVNDKIDSEFGFYSEIVDKEIVPSGDVEKEYFFANNYGGVTLTKITLIEVQPFILNKGEKVSCDQVTRQKVSCT